MPDLILNMSVPHLIIPIICTGTLFISIILFLYFFIQFGDKKYLTMVLSGLSSLIFVGSNLIITVFGELLNYVQIGMQFHRIEQIGGAFFLFCLPLILVNLLMLNERWQKINKIITITGLGFTIIILFSAFVFPDSFISQTVFQERLYNATWHVSRGKEGIIYIARDILLGILILYSIICVVTDMKWHRQYNSILFILAGLLFGIFGALDDTVFVHTGHYIGIFSNIYYSRFSAGVTLFTLSVMSGVMNQFINEVKNVETAYKEKNIANRTLQKINERFKQLAENINEVFLIYDYDNEVFLYISPAYENIWNRSSMSLYESPRLWLDMIFSEDVNIVNSSIGDGKIKDRYDIEYRIIRPDKSVRWIRDRGFPVRDGEGKAFRMVRTQEDITDRKKSEEKLIYLAYYDVLTGLLNRRAFFERLSDIITQSGREKDAIRGILLIHLGEFKTINNTFGDDFGDKILKIVSKTLSKCLRGTDYIFRLSGTEFAVILKNISMEIDASVVANKIISELSMPYNCDNREVFINCCIGISIFPKDSLEADALVKNAHLALIEAKKERNTYRFFNDEMNIKALERITIENNLRYALLKNEFSVNYQPFVNIDGKITGMEALIRWKNPSLGNIPPNKFISIAESTGEIIAIGEWVLRTACSQVKKWKANGYNDLRIAVNISAVQLMDNKFVERIATVLKETGLDPKFLELEITESSVMKNPEDAVIKINKLNDMGVFLAIDDFGVDYSSLSYIKRFKINRLKIDRSFIMDIIADNITAEITKAIIVMAHNLSIKVIAEGIENNEQKKLLESLKCDEMQGYIYSYPLPADEFTKLLKHGGYVYPAENNAARLHN